MSRAAAQRKVTYALLRGRLVPKSQVVVVLSGDLGDEGAVDHPAAPSDPDEGLKPEAPANPTDQPKRGPGRPPKPRADDLSAFEA